MGKTYVDAVAATTKSLPANIEFRKKTVANEQGLRERNLRLTHHEIDQAAMAAAKTSLTQDRSTIGRIVAEDPHFLHMQFEGAGYATTIFNELVHGIAREIVQDINASVEKAYHGQFDGLGVTEIVRELRNSLSMPRDTVATGGPADTAEFEKALDAFEAEPSYDTTLGIMATVDGVVKGLKREGKAEASRRVLEAGYYVIGNSRTDRFIPAPKPARRRRAG